MKCHCVVVEEHIPEPFCQKCHSRKSVILEQEREGARIARSVPGMLALARMDNGYDKT